MPRSEASALLGVAEDAAPSDVQRAYLRAARRTHPDLLPQADESARRAAAAAFDRLTRARDALLVPAPATGASRGAPVDWAARPGFEDGPRFRRVEGRGLGGSLVVLVLLAFLLVALVSLQQGFGGVPVDAPATRLPTTSAPAAP